MVTISKEESAAINSLRLICVLSVVMIHSASLDTPLTPTIPAEYIESLKHWHAVSCFVPYCLGILFIVSGYLFFKDIGCEYNWRKHYVKKIKSRLISLYLFYIAWCLISIIYNVVIKHQEFPSMTEFIMGFWPISQHDPTWGRGMWFIRSLIAFSMLSPFYYVVVRLLKHFTPILCLFLLGFNINITFPYFNVYLLLGCYLGYMGITLTTISKLLDWRIALLVLSTVYVLTRSGIADIPCSSTILILLSLIAYIGLFLKYPICERIASTSTFIYAAHFFIVGGLKIIFFKMLPMSLYGWVCNMWLTWLISSVICIIIFQIISSNNFACMILTGGRGHRPANISQ